MEVSARNQLNGTVQSIKTGAVMAEIIVNVDAGTVAAVITDSSREHLNLHGMKAIRFRWSSRPPRS